MTRIIKFTVSGGTAACVQLGLLFMLTEWVYLWYLVSSSIAYVAAFLVSFLLQKFWTFESRNLALVHREFLWYGCIAIWNGILNGSFLYVGVQVFGLQYLIAQVLTIAIIAVESYFLYHLVFRHDIDSNPSI